jgi:hypothetical protein
MRYFPQRTSAALVFSRSSASVKGSARPLTPTFARASRGPGEPSSTPSHGAILAPVMPFAYVAAGRRSSPGPDGLRTSRASAQVKSNCRMKSGS